MNPTKYILNSDYAQLRISNETKMHIDLPKTIASGQRIQTTATTASASVIFDWFAKSSEDGKTYYGSFPALGYKYQEWTEAVSWDLILTGNTFTLKFENLHDETLTRSAPISFDITIKQFISPFEA